jgi:HD-like signal output (HDOD) protein/ActR/RegA family two-component response regulator
MADRPRILFVDDEPNILQGLRRMLHGVAAAWDLEFALGGEAALAVLQERSFDVVVSDMRMPGMDGAALLARVKAQWPATVRIVLSGYSEHEHVLRSMHEVHQYLRKPFDSEQLKAVIGRSLRLRALLASPRLRAFVGGLSHVPTLPAVYHEVTAAMREDRRSVQEIGELIRKDVGLSAKVLQLVNSAFFGLPRRLVSPGEAAVVLGLETLRALVLGMNVFATVEAGSRSAAQLDELAEHSLRVATLARRCARHLGLDRATIEEAFVAGFLHEVGKLVFMVNAPEQYEQTLRVAQATGAHDWQVEERTFGAGHPVVGAYLLAIWGLPDTLVEALAHVHEPAQAHGAAVGALTALHVADVTEEGLAARQPRVRRELDVAWLERAGVAAAVAAWRAQVAAEAACGALA